MDADNVARAVFHDIKLLRDLFKRFSVVCSTTRPSCVWFGEKEIRLYDEDQKDPMYKTSGRWTLNPSEYQCKAPTTAGVFIKVIVDNLNKWTNYIGCAELVLDAQMQIKLSIIENGKTIFSSMIATHVYDQKFKINKHPITARMNVRALERSLKNMLSCNEGKFEYKINFPGREMLLQSTSEKDNSSCKVYFREEELELIAVEAVAPLSAEKNRPRKRSNSDNNSDNNGAFINNDNNDDNGDDNNELDNNELAAVGRVKKVSGKRTSSKKDAGNVVKFLVEPELLENGITEAAGCFPTKKILKLVSSHFQASDSVDLHVPPETSNDESLALDFTNKYGCLEFGLSKKENDEKQ